MTPIATAFATSSGLVEKVRALFERDSVKLLQENLEQEKEALKTVGSISKRMLKGSPEAKRTTRSNGGSKPRERAKAKA